MNALCVSFMNYLSNITLYVTVHLSLIWLSRFVPLYTRVYIYIHIYNLSKVFIILTLLVKCKISIISSIDPMECLLSKRCCAKRRFSIALFEIQEVFVEFYLQWSASFVQYTFCYNHDMLTDRHHNCQICLD